MFKPVLFNGTEEQVIHAADLFWSDYASLLEKEKVSDRISPFGGEIAKQRTVKFYDTHTRLFRQHHLVVRERFNVLKKKNALSLKFRHPDRYIASEHNIHDPDKIEEDIKPTFQVLHSISKKEKVPASGTYEHVADLTKTFPEIDLPEDLPVTVVGDFTAHEKVIADGSFQIGDEIAAESALIIWYNDNRSKETPLLVEFSFRYQCERDKHTAAIARKAFRAFQLCTTLNKWYNPNQMTKTSYVFGLALDEKFNRSY